MTKEKELFEILSELIQVQIKKYVKLSTIGMGPDARSNAALVLDEVEELLACQKTLLSAVEENSSHEVFNTIYNQVKFYVEQEHFLGEAGWLLDKNNFHINLETPIKKQLQQLDELAKKNENAKDFAIPAQPMTPIQEQCQHNTYAIAKRILGLAKLIKDFSKKEHGQALSLPIDKDSSQKKNDQALSLALDKELSLRRMQMAEHVKQILMRNVERYKDYESMIDAQYAQCVQFLESSTLMARTSQLEPSEAKKMEKLHQQQWNDSVRSYKKLEHNSTLELFEEKFQQEVVSSAFSKSSFFAKTNLALICGGLAVGGLISVLLPYLMPKEDDVGPSMLQ